MKNIFTIQSRIINMKLIMALVLTTLAITTASAASICYKITLDDGTSWQICRESTDLNFTMQGFVEGKGYLMETKDIDLAKVGLKAITKSMPESSDVMNFNAQSQVYSEQNINVDSKIVNTTYAYTATGSGENETVDTNVTIIFPVKLSYESKLIYTGKEARSKEFIFNNYNGVTAKVEGKNITKHSNADVDMNFIYAKAHLEPGVVRDALFANGTFDYSLDSFANELTKFCAKYYDAKIDESYYGSFNVKKSVNFATKVELPSEEEAKDWLSCPD